MSQMGHISTDGGDDCECEQKEFLEKKNTMNIFFSFKITNQIATKRKLIELSCFNSIFTRNNLTWNSNSHHFCSFFWFFWGVKS